eukprot:TRINITY_DN5741_c0_g1_i3.p1 TRINITY_DN5741_c0_g1~~TRINITY_DN5741_c0_g1_i3.p1  ORF type:complete len:329 (-),score=67.18 TRINITY_DN5741_c0_g1_i3:1419-2405(-)
MANGLAKNTKNSCNVSFPVDHIALITNGRNWQLIAKEIPRRTLLQIQVRAKLIFSKIEKEVPKNITIIDFMREKGLEWFETKEIANKFKFDNEDYDSSDPPVKEAITIVRKRPKNKQQKDTSNIKLRARPKQKLNREGSEKKQRKIRKRGRKRDEKDSESEEPESLESPSKSESAVSEIEETPDETRFSSAIRVVPRLRPADPLSTDLYKVPPPPATILPFNTIGEALNKLITDLTNFEGRLENDYMQRAVQLDNNMEVGEYWRGLKDCSISLLHIVNDIALLHQHNEIIRKNNMLVQDFQLYPQQMYPMNYSEAMQGKGGQYQLNNN